MRRLLASLAAVVGLSPSAAGAATPTTMSPQAAPAAWVAYANLVNQAITSQLGGFDPAATRLRDYLDEIPGATPEGRVQLPLRVWIDGAGVITRIDFALFAHPEPNADLQALLVGHRLPQVPPKAMLLPIRLMIGLEPAPADAGSPAAERPRSSF
ncbi:hypothetical protein [Caulobacter soli]|uniref:hypothetical protein n=1 Tax=Caulobacter soli TaxID=2708539 RepID=UPI0013EC80F7|nr:hypothetical protein [Caulobacter soli]